MVMCTNSLIPRVGQNHIYIRCAYGIFWQEITTYTVRCGEYIWSWPTLLIPPQTPHLLCISTGPCNPALQQRAYIHRQTHAYTYISYLCCPCTSYIDTRIHIYFIFVLPLYIIHRMRSHKSVLECLIGTLSMSSRQRIYPTSQSLRQTIQPKPQNLTSSI